MNGKNSFNSPRRVLIARVLTIERLKNGTRRNSSFQTSKSQPTWNDNMIKKTVFALVFSFGLFALCDSEANAQINGLSQIRTYGNRVFTPKPPYFALHPPVYYDRVVPRAYGMSPFAAPAGVMPIENTVPQKAKSVSNPFYKGEKVVKSAPKGKKASATKTKTVTESRAKKVTNPFYLQKVVNAG